MDATDICGASIESADQASAKLNGLHATFQTKHSRALLAQARSMQVRASRMFRVQQDQRLGHMVA